MAAMRPVLAGVAAAMLALAGCGSAERGGAEREQPAGIDGTYLRRAIAVERLGLDIALAGAHARDDQAARIGQATTRLRQRTLRLLTDARRRVRRAGADAPLRTGRHAAGQDLTADGLDAARPFLPAFLGRLTANTTGSMALAREEVRRGRDPLVVSLARQILVEHGRALEQLQ